MNKISCISTSFFVMTACMIIMLLDGCSNQVVVSVSNDPILNYGVSINGIGMDFNQLRNSSDRTNYALIRWQNFHRAKEYSAQGILKMNSKDTNDLKLARRLFNASLSFDDTSPEVWGYLGDVYVQESQLIKNNSNNDKLMNAIYYYNKAIELDSMNNLFYYERANCYYSIGDTAYFSDYRKSCNLGNSKACIVIK